MDVEPYIESVRRQLEVAAETGGDEARTQAERLVAPLEAAIRLAIQDALAAAAEEITLELAPGSVELRLRGRDPGFVVTLPPAEAPAEETGATEDTMATAWRTSPRPPGDGDDATVSRFNLRMPERLKSLVEEAAAAEGLSLNAWLVRAAGAALDRTDRSGRQEPRGFHGAQRHRGWAR